MPSIISVSDNEYLIDKLDTSSLYKEVNKLFDNIVFTIFTDPPPAPSFFFFYEIAVSFLKNVLLII